MKKFFYFTIAAICSASGCASTESIKTVENKTVANLPSVSVNNQPDANRDLTVNVNNNANKIVIGDTSISKKNNRNWEAKNLGSKESQPIAEKIVKNIIPAPDNSEIFNQMNEKGQPVETRTFKKHSILQKIERIDLDNRNIKIYLKNGKNLTLPENSAEKFLTASAAEILTAVGISVK